MKLLWTIVVVIAIAAGIFLYRTRDTTTEPNNNQSQQPPPTPTPAPAPSPTPTPSETPNPTEEIPAGNTWTGTLRTSNVKAKGNLMLELTDSDHIIYLNTSRDWSALIGKEVVVTYDGTIDSFTLVDIKAK